MDAAKCGCTIASFKELAFVIEPENYRENREKKFDYKVSYFKLITEVGSMFACIKLFQCLNQLLIDQNIISARGVPSPLNQHSPHYK